MGGLVRFLGERGEPALMGGGACSMFLQKLWTKLLVVGICPASCHCTARVWQDIICILSLAMSLDLELA